MPKRKRKTAGRAAVASRPAAPGRTGPPPGRPRRGVEIANAKLNDGVVERTRQAVAAGAKSADLARELDVARSTVCKVLSAKSWKHAPGTTRPSRARRPNGETGERSSGARQTQRVGDGTRKLNDKIVAKCLGWNEAGETGTAITERLRVLGYDVSVTSVNAALRGKTWKHVPGARRAKQIHGQDRPNAKLNDGVVVEILAWHGACISVPAITQRLHDRGIHVSMTTVYEVVRGETWMHVPGARRPKGARGGRPKLNPDRVSGMRRLAAAGVSIDEITRLNHVAYHTAYQAVRGKTWNDVSEPPVPAGPAGGLSFLIRLGPGRRVVVLGEAVDSLSPAEFELIHLLYQAGPAGRSGAALRFHLGADAVNVFHRLRRRGGVLGSVLYTPRRRGPKRVGNPRPEDNYRLGFPGKIKS